MDIPIPKPILDVDNWFKSTFNFDGHGNYLSSSNRTYYYSIQNIIKKIGNSQGDIILKYIKESIDDCEVKQDTMNCNYVFYKKGFAFTISERDFNQYCSRGAWHDRLKQHRRDDQLLHLAWENECLRKKIEELDQTLKNFISNCDIQEVD
tara:strand:+ start:228 stop:677 length:450 start_codon:yes stop_codon:yes gene_type:complete